MNKELLKLKTIFIEKNIKFEKNYIDEDELTKLREEYGHTDNVPDLRFDSNSKKFFKIDSNILSNEELNQILLLKLNEKIIDDKIKQKNIDELININRKNLSAIQSSDAKINTIKNIMIFWVVLTIINLILTLYVFTK